MLIDKFDIGNQEAEEFRFQTEKYFQQNWKTINPIIATNIQRIARVQFNTDNIYREEKEKANSTLLKQYSFWSNRVKTNHEPFHLAAKLAVIGNIIDYGAHSVPQNLEDFINKQLDIDFFHNETDRLFSAIKQADSILYLGDNAGEIVFDKLFIETINHPNITYVVRGSNVLNDVTLEDAQAVGIQNLCKVIDNGYDAPSTLLEFCSSEFLNEFNKADLIISKGQGNFEGLIEYSNPKLFFMLMAKCNIIANLLKAPKGSMIIKQQVQ